jgi:hypothetical protein
LASRLINYGHKLIRTPNAGRTFSHTLKVMYRPVALMDAILAKTSFLELAIYIACENPMA